MSMWAFQIAKNPIKIRFRAVLRDVRYRYIVYIVNYAKSKRFIAFNIVATLRPL